MRLGAEGEGLKTPKLLMNGGQKSGLVVPAVMQTAASAGSK